MKKEHKFGTPYKKISNLNELDNHIIDHEQ